MWDSHLERIAFAKHQIHLNPLDAQPAHATPYRKGPWQRQLEVEETKQMLKVHIAKPATTK